jgi:hypothetical protein
MGGTVQIEVWETSPFLEGCLRENSPETGFS